MQPKDMNYPGNGFIIYKEATIKLITGKNTTEYTDTELTPNTNILVQGESEKWQ